MTRFRAAGIHLVLSVLVVLTVLALMLFVWYPNGLFKLLGGTGLLYIIAGVDVTLGPLLTFVVFKAGKKSLKFDLSVIAIMQISALLYGANVMFQSRPVFNVLEEDVFKVALASDFTDKKKLLRAKKAEWQSLSITGPLVVAALAPTTDKEKEELVFAAAGGLDWYAFPNLYVDYDSQRSVALKNAKPLASIRKVSADANLAVEEFLSKHKKTEENFVYLPIVAGYVAMTAVLDAKNADFIEIIDVDPS